MSYRVTGGAGFIGSHLAEALSKCGERVRIFDNLSTGSRDHITNHVELVAGDLQDAHQRGAGMPDVRNPSVGLQALLLECAVAAIPTAGNIHHQVEDLFPGEGVEHPQRHK